MTSPSEPTSNFDFMAVHGPLFVRLPSLAERYLHDDPNTAILKIRQFGELIAQHAAARLGLDTERVDQFQAIQSLRMRGAIDDRIASVFHTIRKSGNLANHEFRESKGEAIHLLKHARQLGAWYHRFSGHRGFKLGPFVHPQPPVDPTAAIRERLEAVQHDLEAMAQQVEESTERAEIEAELRRVAEAKAKAHEDDAQAAFELVEEYERRLTTEAEAEVAQLAAEAATTPADEMQRVVDEAAKAASEYDPDETETRHLIDQQLRDAGWDVDSETLRHSKGTRPVKGRDLAIAEWPTDSGPADYVLFRGLTPIAVVEAKRRNRNVAGVIPQAKRYSRGIRLDDDLRAHLAGPWGEVQIPFLFTANGRPFLRQLEELSGIWFLDARQPTNHPRARDGWPTPDDLGAMLAQDIPAADRALEATTTDYLPLRNYQHEAVRAVETAIRAGRREMLLAMATGTGKTRTAICLIYRLIKAGRFRRVLFLVDRSILGEQAHGSFKDLRLEQQQSFTEIYDVKELGELRPDADTRLHIATVQGMVQRLFYPSENAPPLSVDAYDCILVDECHRGYNLDRQLSDAELNFRDEADYISKYRRVLDHFDAVKVGLTATPALHTTEIFGRPIYEYSLRQGIIDGFLIDHEPPILIKTELGEDGIRWRPGEEVESVDAKLGQRQLFETPDEIRVEIDGFNRKVLTKNFNRTVCHFLAEHIDPQMPGKTLIYCVNDLHADLVVRLLKEAFADEYGEVDDEAVQKITGAIDKPSAATTHFKNERMPSVAVTVDLLTTGVDVEEIVNLVFLRRVRSRILYTQMIGRATRPCEKLFGDRDKEVFHIYDAVGVYDALQDLADMRPVVTNPKVTFTQLAHELATVDDDAFRQQAQDQFVAKLQRVRRTIEERWADDFEAAAGATPTELIATIRTQTPEETAAFLTEHAVLVELLDRRRPSSGSRFLVSHHEDAIRRIEHGYGDATRPDDYLESFGRFLDEHADEIRALKIVMTRPRELTRAQLKALKLELDRRGFTEAKLKAAYRDATNQDIAASIIGYIRQRALGTPLEPYDERVRKAVRRVLEERRWKSQQRQWIERIGDQMIKETVVDLDALDRGAFGAQGGLKRLNRVFQDATPVPELLSRLHDYVWKESA